MAKVFLTSSWDMERIAPYLEEIIASFREYDVARTH